MKRKLACPGATIEYELERKPVKNINLRVRRDGSVHVSAGRLVPETVIESFIRSRAEFILRAQRETANRSAPEAKEYIEGESVRIFDREYPLLLVKGKRNHAVFDGKSVILTAREDAGAAQRERAVDRLLRGLCEERLTALCNKWRPVFDAWIPDAPELRFRSMKSRWGSCQPRRGVITFNTALVGYPEAAAEYVAVHELTHFLHADHSAGFYASLATVLPDWKERKRLLK